MSKPDARTTDFAEPLFFLTKALTCYSFRDKIQTDVRYKQVIAMNTILYLNFIGARASHEMRTRCLKESTALVVLEEDLVADCDEEAWLDGVRPGDTLRQARIASPGCQVVRFREAGDTEGLKEILDALSRVSPYIEPSTDGRGIFVDVSPGVSIPELAAFLGKSAGGESVSFQAFIGEARSKLLARASSDWLFREYVEDRRIFPGKTAWGGVDRGEGYFLASVHEGREKAFLSGAALNSLWPAPPEILSVLRSLGLKKVRDVREVPLTGLVRHIGDWAFLVKEWSEGEDRTPVKALYPPPCIEKEMSFQEPIALEKALFAPALKGLSSALVEKGVGFKVMRVSLSGDFPALYRERKFVRPVSSLEAMKTALGAILDEVSRECGAVLSCPVVSGFTLKLDEIAPVQAKPIPLISDSARGVKKAVPVALGLAIAGIERKFGDEAVSWGRPDDHGIGFKPEIMRREKMLSLWDPMRPGLEESGCQR